MIHDIIIVGGGPAGATCAKHVATNKEIDVVLLEKGNIDRYKPCGGGVMFRNEKDFGSLPAEVIDADVDTFTMGSFSKIATIEFSKAGIDYGKLVYRDRFDKYLLEEAQKEGATLRTNSEVISAKRAKDHVELELKDKSRLKTRCLVIATGANNTRLQRQLNIDRPVDIVNTVQAEFELPENVIKERFGGGSWELYFDTAHIAKHGYAWIFAKKSGLTVGYLDKMVSVDKFKEIIKGHPIIKEKLKDSKIKEIEGKKYWAHPIADRIVEYTFDDRILLIGEAAGFIDRFTYEGIWHARKSGQLAAETLLKSHKKQDYSIQILRGYENKWIKNLYDCEDRSIYFSRMDHHFYYHSGFLDEFVDAIITVLQEKQLIEDLLEQGRKEGREDILFIEALQLKIVDELQKKHDKKTFSRMFKEFRRRVLL